MRTAASGFGNEWQQQGSQSGIRIVARAYFTDWKAPAEPFNRLYPIPCVQRFVGGGRAFLSEVARSEIEHKTIKIGQREIKCITFEEILRRSAVRHRQSSMEGVRFLHLRLPEIESSGGLKMLSDCTSRTQKVPGNLDWRRREGSGKGQHSNLPTDAASRLRMLEQSTPIEKGPRHLR